LVSYILGSLQLVGLSQSRHTCKHINVTSGYVFYYSGMFAIIANRYICTFWYIINKLSSLYKHHHLIYKSYFTITKCITKRILNIMAIDVIIEPVSSHRMTSIYSPESLKLPWCWIQNQYNQLLTNEETNPYIMFLIIQISNRKHSCFIIICNNPLISYYHYITWLT
jgi:hypothetical protein